MLRWLRTKFVLRSPTSLSLSLLNDNLARGLAFRYELTKSAEGSDKLCLATAVIYKTVCIDVLTNLFNLDVLHYQSISSVV